MAGYAIANPPYAGPRGRRTEIQWFQLSLGIVAAGGLLGCVAIGGMFSLPVLLQPIARDTGWSVAGSPPADHRLPRHGLHQHDLGYAVGQVRAAAGGADGIDLIAVSLALASRATSLIEFQFLFGLMVGGATAAIFAPMMATVTGWSTPIAALQCRWSRRHGHGADDNVADGGLLGLDPRLAHDHADPVGRRRVHHDPGVAARPPAAGARRQCAYGRQRVAAAGADPRQAIRSPQFIILLATNFFCCATHSGPIIHTVSYAISCGIPLVAAVTIYSVEGLAGLFGRIGFGLAGDRFGAKRVLVIGLLVQAFGALAYAFVHELAGFYSVAALFGFVYAGTMPLYSVLVRENFPLRILGTIIGGTAMAGSLGMATGPLAGGLIYDTFASYAWLYIGSWAFGLGAFFIAMTFRPFPGSSQRAWRWRHRCHAPRDVMPNAFPCGSIGEVSPKTVARKPA